QPGPARAEGTAVATLDQPGWPPQRRPQPLPPPLLPYHLPDLGPCIPVIWPSPPLAAPAQAVSWRAGQSRPTVVQGPGLPLPEPEAGLLVGVVQPAGVRQGLLTGVFGGWGSGPEGTGEPNDGPKTKRRVAVRFWGEGPYFPQSFPPQGPFFR